MQNAPGSELGFKGSGAFGFGDVGPLMRIFGALGVGCASGLLKNPIPGPGDMFLCNLECFTT